MELVNQWTQAYLRKDIHARHIWYAIYFKTKLKHENSKIIVDLFDLIGAHPFWVMLSLSGKSRSLCFEKSKLTLGKPNTQTHNCVFVCRNKCTNTYQPTKVGLWQPQDIWSNELPVEGGCCQTQMFINPVKCTQIHKYKYANAQICTHQSGVFSVQGGVMEYYRLKASVFKPRCI